MNRNYTYKCVSLPRNMTLQKSKSDPNAVPKFIEETINHHCVNGWMFDKVITTHTHIPAGCIPIFGAPAQNIANNIIVFRKITGEV